MMNRRTRRQFLEDSMFAAAAAVTHSSGERLLAEDVGSKSPSERLGVAIIGVRGRGNSHIGEFAGRRDTRVLYICDTDEDVGMQRVKQVAKRQGGPEPDFTVDLRHVLDDPRVDVVSIATPHHWHALAALWSMQAGKDVYLEKPVSHNVAEGRRLVEAAQKYRRICQTGTQCRSNPGMIDAMRYLHDGHIGAVNLGRGYCAKPRGSIGPRGVYGVPGSVHYDLWLGPAPRAPLTRPKFHYDWHWQWAYGNGDLGNQGIHLIDVARWGLGIDRLSESVFSFGGRFGYEDAGETANTQIAVHGYGDRALVCEVHSLRSGNYKHTRIGVIFEGTDGYLVMTSYSGGAAFDLDGHKLKQFSGTGNHFDNFLKAVRSRDRNQLHADIVQGHYSSALCHTANISYLLGEEVVANRLRERLPVLPSTAGIEQLVNRALEHLRGTGVDLETTPLRVGTLLTFDPEREMFLGHEAANQLLSREYREGFEVPDSADKI